MSTNKTVVKVSIVGEDYTIRSDATPEHTRAVADYLDKAIRKVMQAGAGDTHRAAILAALQITDELFKAQDGSVELTAELRQLGAEIRRLLPPAKREAGAAGD